MTCLPFIYDKDDSSSNVSPSLPNLTVFTDVFFRLDTSSVLLTEPILLLEVRQFLVQKTLSNISVSEVRVFYETPIREPVFDSSCSYGSLWDENLRSGHPRFHFRFLSMVYPFLFSKRVFDTKIYKNNKSQKCLFFYLLYVYFSHEFYSTKFAVRK